MVELMAELSKPVYPGDAFFLMRPALVESQAMRIAAMPLATEYGGTVPDEFHLTVQRARDIAPQDWERVLTDLHLSLQGIRPFKLEAIGLWRFYSQFRQSNAIFWTMRQSTSLLKVRKALDEVLEKYGATKYPYPLEEWKPHTLALQNAHGADGDLKLSENLPRPSFTVNSLSLSIYLPWGVFAEHPVAIFSAK